ncbi:MAG: GNAT family N-acetyltransferase [Chloroflexota bacterium]|nr:GNAT family N-acetyltransferase [Chloroflexota bacterium]
MLTDKSDTIKVRGHKVILRGKRISDAENDYAWATDKDLMYLDAAEPYKMSFAEFYVRYRAGLNDIDDKRVAFGIETLDGEYIGNCVCYNIDRFHKEAELGIIIGDRKYWGKGYGSDAMKTLMRYSFQDIGLEKLSLHTLEWNIRAQECFERSGFVRRGLVTRQGHEFVEMEAVAHPSEARDSV